MKTQIIILLKSTIWSEIFGPHRSFSWIWEYDQQWRPNKLSRLKRKKDIC